MLELSESAQTTAGFVLLAAITVTSGGFFLTRIVRGNVPATDFQMAFYRAGHAHAGMLITLGLVCLMLADSAEISGVAGWFARTGVLFSAILMPAGFFLSALGKGRTQPNGLVVLLYAGAAVLIAGLGCLGVGLLM